jgi:putative SOS response-associated peptidase YedK
MTVPEGFAFAGLWAASRFGLSCSIITTAAVGDLTRIHDRMPLLLEPGRWEEWLTGPAGGSLLAPPPLDYVASIEVRPVGPAVGNVRNDGPELIEPVGGPEIQESLF